MHPPSFIISSDSPCKGGNDRFYFILQRYPWKLCLIKYELDFKVCVSLYCLFYFRPFSGHWISTFYRSLTSHEHKEANYTIFANKFCIGFCTMRLIKRTSSRLFWVNQTSAGTGLRLNIFSLPVKNLEPLSSRCEDILDSR